MARRVSVLAALAVGFVLLVGAVPVGSSATSTTPLTYDQIMTQIAHYPGPDEPLYVPAEGEQIWLTDLEGHADIYDNDSIKINYAPGFDRSQITQIYVSRNNVRMRFLPALFDVVTNVQMKTFDGNPSEHTPASSHTDHAIFGYRYVLQFYATLSHSPSLPYSALSVTVKSPVHVPSTHMFASLWGSWFYPLVTNWKSSAEMSEYLRTIRALGIHGIQLDVELYTDGSSIFPVTAQDIQRDPTLCDPLVYTAPDDVIVQMLDLIRAEGMEAELRIQLDPIGRDQVNGYWSAAIDPGPGTQGDEWFKSYREALLHYADLAEQCRASFFCPIVELNTAEQYTEGMTTLYRAIDQRFSGRLTGSEQTTIIVGGDTLRTSYGQFWGYDDIVIGMNAYNDGLDDTTDQHFSRITSQMRRFWAPPVLHYRAAFPGHDLVFAEVGLPNFNGAAATPWPTPEGAVRDDQEQADFWAATLLTAASLRLDGMCVWAFEFCAAYWYTGSLNLYENRAAQAVIRALLSG